MERLEESPFILRTCKECLSHSNFTEIFLKGEESISLLCVSLALNVLSGWGNLTAFVLKLALILYFRLHRGRTELVINTQEISNQQWQRDKAGVWTHPRGPNRQRRGGSQWQRPQPQHVLISAGSDAFKRTLCSGSEVKKQLLFLPLCLWLFTLESFFFKGMAVSAAFRCTWIKQR